MRVYRPQVVLFVCAFAVLCAASARAAITATPPSVSAFPTQSTPPITLNLTFGPVPGGQPGTVSATGLPAGVTTVPSPISYVPQPGALNATTSFTFSLGAGVIPGNYLITLTDNTNASGSTTVTLIVNTPSFSASATPNPVTLTTGGPSQPVTVTTTQRDPGFNPASITYSFSGFPAFIINNGPQTSLSDFSYPPVTFNFSVGGGAIPGTYTGTLTGTPTTGAPKSFPFTVIVQQPDIAASFTQPAVTLCNGQTVPDAIQLAPLNGYTGTPTLTFTSLPSGITINPPTPIAARMPPAQTIPISVSAAGARSGVAVLNVSDPAAGINKNIQLQINVTPADFSATVTPPALTLTAGGSGQNVLASITPNSCLNSDVTVAASGQPAGLVVAPNPATITTPGFSPVAISIRAAAATTPGTYPITFTFTSAGITRTAIVQVTVGAAPDFLLVVDPANVTIQAGSSGPTSVRITPINQFAGTVSVTAPSSPGITIDPPAFTLTAGVSQNVTISVGANVPAGVIPLTFSATAPNVSGTRTAVLQLTVTAPVGFALILTPNSVTIPAGGSTPVIASITTQGAFNGTVAVTAPAVPGISFTPSSFTLTAGATKTITVAVDPAAAPGPRGALLFQATSPGLPPSSASLDLTVGARPDFSISVNPTSVSVRNGGSATVTVRATGANGFTGPITVNTSAAAGVHIDPSSFTLTDGGSQVVTISVTGSPAGGAASPIVFTATAPGAASPHTATVLLTVLPAAPVLTSAAPGSLVVGTQSTTVRVAGDFLQPGAQFHSSDPSLVIESSTVLTPQLADVRVTVRSNAAPGPRSITVTNPDGGTSSTPVVLLVYPSSSIAAPLDVLAAAIVYPAQGTMMASNETVYARGLLATAGTGTISGTWQFDGAPFDRFVLNAAGGMPVEVRTSVPIPTSFIGSHTLTIAIDSPRKFVAPAINVVDSADRASRLALLAPRDGAVIRGPEQLFRWSLVPNCSGYDVEVALPGLATTPDATTPMARFHVNAAEWKPAAADIAAIGPGIHRWRVRPRCAGDVELEPSAWQRFAILPDHVDISLQPMTTNDHGARVVHWQSGVSGLLYRVEFLSPSGDTLFGALTSATEYVVPREFPAGTIVRVSAIGPDGRILGTSTTSPLSRGFARNEFQLVAETLIEISHLEPDEGSTITNPQPHIAAQWTGSAPADQVMLLVDNVDVTQVAKITPSSVAYDSLIALSAGEHSVAIAVAGNIRRWTFKVGGEQPAATGAAPAAAEPTPAQPRGDWVVAPIGSITLVHAGSNEARTQLSGLTDLNESSFTNKATGDVSLRHNFDNNRTAQESRNWITDFGAKQEIVGENARLGFAPPDFFDQAQLMSAGLPRGGVQAKMTVPYGTMSYYETFTSRPAGMVTGLFGPEQKVRAAAYVLPVNPKWDLRVVGLRVDEAADQNSTGGQGRALAVFGRYTIGTAINAVVEAARGDFTPKVEFFENRRKGAAARIGLNGARGTLNYALNLRRTEANFVNPANRGFTPAGVPDRFGGDLTIGKFIGTTSITAQLRHLHDGTTSSLPVPRTRENGGLLTLTRPLTSRVSLALSGNFTADKGSAKPEIELPRADRNQSGGTATLSESLGRLYLSESVSRQATRDRVNGANDQTTTFATLTAGGQMNTAVYLSTVLSGTRLEGSPIVGTTDQYLAALQPIISIQKLFLSFQPRASYSTSTNDLVDTKTTTEQYQALVMFSPQWFKSLFAVQLSGDWTRNKFPGAIGGTPFVRRYVASFNLHWREGKGPAFTQGALMMPVAQPLVGMNPAMSAPGTGVPGIPH